MGMPGMKAQHITLALEEAHPPFEIQLLEFEPAPGTDPGAHPTNLRQRGFNHLAFRVDDIEAATAHLVANGITILSDERGIALLLDLRELRRNGMSCDFGRANFNFERKQHTGWFAGD
jgi:catechol 2,3-dioxygenase-like lactoylglutathione lyase family enzyme